jgi:hypothetical protein
MGWKLKLEGGGTLVPKDSDPVLCETHGFSTTWGDLNDIQKLAVRDGIDTKPEFECILAERRTR